MTTETMRPAAPAPSISVIIAAWQEATQIADAVASARAAGADEVIVIDGGSTDETVSRATTAGATAVLMSTLGRAKQQNAGARLATGDVLFFVHADCRVSAALLGQLRQQFRTHLDLVAGCCRQALAANGWRYRWLEWGNLRRALWWGWSFGDQGQFVLRRVFDEVGGFPDWPLLEDVELNRRLQGCGRRVVLTQPLTVSARRWQKQGLLRQTFLNWLILSLYSMGVSPSTLSRLYRSIR
jgi:rSAM/selenodomain-associated transferase 2